MDALTGQVIGWPRSATFRTIDLVGLDVLGHVVENMAKMKLDGGTSRQASRSGRESAAGFLSEDAGA